MILEPRAPLTELTEDQLTSLYDRVDAFTNRPSYRNCLIPGCMKQFDSISWMSGDPPPRPELSGKGWHTLGSGSIFPAGGHICPDHAPLLREHFPRRLQLPNGRWSIDCACEWTPTPQRWHGVLKALWEQHILTVTDVLPEAPPLTDPEHRTPLADLDDNTLAELYDRLWDAEGELVDAREAGRAVFLAYEQQRKLTGEQATLLASVHNALYSLRSNLVKSSRDWSLERTDAWLWALLVGWDCEEEHQHGEDCEPGAFDDVAKAHRWSDIRIELARKHRSVLAQAGPNDETEAAAARAAMLDKDARR
ncbi:hypothetical protein ACFQ6Q_00645 [Streptomyces sp. NPDC056437]|uniref:hypothetical protein n=1 Tax=Streptomyces sp. NPDC056437 TaxID=3345816 RepID=UPI0036CC86A6